MKKKEPEKRVTVLTDFKKNLKTLKSLYISKDLSIYLKKYNDIFGKNMYMVTEVYKGKEITHAIRDGETAAYMVYRRLEKKITGV